MATGGKKLTENKYLTCLSQVNVHYLPKIDSNPIVMLDLITKYRGGNYNHNIDVVTDNGTLDLLHYNYQCMGLSMN